MEVKKRTIARFLGHWVGLSVFYCWLIAKSQAEQLVAAIAIGLVSAVCLLTLSGRAGLHIEFKVRWLGILCLRLPGKALRDMGILISELGRSVITGQGATGALKELPFISGGKDPKSRGKRALVISGISLPPNTIAISAQPNTHSILVHQLAFRSETPQDKEWPL